MIILTIYEIFINAPSFSVSPWTYIYQHHAILFLINQLTLLACRVHTCAPTCNYMILFLMEPFWSITSSWHTYINLNSLETRACHSPKIYIQYRSTCQVLFIGLKSTHQQVLIVVMWLYIKSALSLCNNKTKNRKQLLIVSFLLRWAVKYVDTYMHAYVDVRNTMDGRSSLFHWKGFLALLPTKESHSWSTKSCTPKR